MQGHLALTARVLISVSWLSPRRWLLPPQALNAYYLPNKNQMGMAPMADSQRSRGF